MVFPLIVGVVAMTVIIMIQRFYKSLLGNEGYLMFTLPVHAWQHIVSKLIEAMVWTILSFLITVSSVLGIAKVRNLQEGIVEGINAFREIFGAAGFFVLPGSALISLASSILMIYAAIALGHLFAKQKLIASFAMYCALYIVSQMFTIILLLPFMRMLVNILEITTTFAAVVMVPTIILTVGYYLLTTTLLQKKLNLE